MTCCSLQRICVQGIVDLIGLCFSAQWPIALSAIARLAAFPIRKETKSPKKETYWERVSGCWLAAKIVGQQK